MEFQRNKKQSRRWKQLEKQRDFSECVAEERGRKIVSAKYSHRAHRKCTGYVDLPHKGHEFQVEKPGGMNKKGRTAERIRVRPRGRKRV